MKLTTKLLIFALCLLAEFLGGYIFVKYAVMSTSKLWLYCTALILASVATQMMVVTE